MKKNLAILIGLPGSGKTTYSNDNLKNYLRISQDEQGKRHYRRFLEEILGGTQNIVIDRVNVTKEQRQRYILPARYLGYRIVYYKFSCPDHLLYQRLIDRKDHPTIKSDNTKVHKQIIGRFKNQYQEPEYSEYDELNII